MIKPKKNKFHALVKFWTTDYSICGNSRWFISVNKHHKWFWGKNLYAKKKSSKKCKSWKFEFHFPNKCVIHTQFYFNILIYFFSFLPFLRFHSTDFPMNCALFQLFVSGWDCGFYSCCHVFMYLLSVLLLLLLHRSILKYTTFIYENQPRTSDRDNWGAGYVHRERVNDKFNVRDWGFTWAASVYLLES